MLAITGDFDTETLVAQIEKVFEGWKATKIAFPNVPTVDATSETLPLIISSKISIRR